MKIPFCHVEAFSEAPFSGNPAAVFLLPEPRPADWMLSVARRLNLSETAFVVRDQCGFGLRWFTPQYEVDLCGPATLASAHVLWAEGILGPGEQARFFTRCGTLHASRRGDTIELEIPARTPRPVAPPPILARALGAEPRYVGRHGDDLVVLLDDDETVAGLRPEFRLLNRLPAGLVIPTAPSIGTDHDFTFRVFVPALEFYEVPISVAAHCCLGSFWRDRLDKTTLRGLQASGRGGTVDILFTDCANDDGERVVIKGRAVTVRRGELLN